MTDQKEAHLLDARFELRVVKMIHEQNLSVSQVCKDFGLEDVEVRRWLAQYREETASRSRVGKPPASGQQRTYGLEDLARLRKAHPDLLKMPDRGCS